MVPKGPPTAPEPCGALEPHGMWWAGVCQLGLCPPRPLAAAELTVPGIPSPKEEPQGRAPGAHQKTSQARLQAGAGALQSHAGAGTTALRLRECLLTNWEAPRYIMRGQRLGSCERAACWHPVQPKSALPAQSRRGNPQILHLPLLEVPELCALLPGTTGTCGGSPSSPSAPLPRGRPAGPARGHRARPDAARGWLRSRRGAAPHRPPRGGQARTAPGLLSLAEPVINTPPGLCEESRAFRTGTLR